jgi:hypothetical protein
VIQDIVNFFIDVWEWFGFVGVFAFIGFVFTCIAVPYTIYWPLTHVRIVIIP